MRLTSGIFGMSLVALVAACSPPVPDSGAPAGARETDLGGAVAPTPSANTSAAPLNATLAQPPATGVAPTPPAQSPSGISDEQDFTAVSARQTIESDAARIEANRAQYVIVEPKDLPVRPGSGDLALVVEYALATTNGVGQPLYRRAGAFGENRFTRNCARYASADLAQADFLNRGGPKRDAKGLDPDGDGFACYWDPSPFRQARAAAVIAEPAPVIAPEEG